MNPFLVFLGDWILNAKKRNQLLTVLKTLGALNVLKKDDSCDIYIVEKAFLKVMMIINFLGSIGAYFECCPVTNEKGNITVFHIIIHDYSSM